MSIRLIALDLDGTLVNSRWEISEKDLEALTAASALGVQIAVVTGRRTQAAASYVSKIPFPVTVITSNGALIRSAAGEIAYRNFLPRQVARQVLEAVQAFRPYTVAMFDVPARGQIIMEDCAVREGPLGWYLTSSMDYLQQVPDLNAVVNVDPIQIMIGGPPSRIEGADALLRQSEAASRVQITWTKYPWRNVFIMDVMNLGCSKGAALKFWANKNGIPASDIMAMGDNFNDVEMLEFAGLPVVMGNHIEGLHRAGWALTSACDDSGVASAIEKFVLGT